MRIKIKQQDITDCGAACLASVAAHYRLKIPIAQIRQIAGTDKKGTNLYGLYHAAEALGFQCKGVRGDVEALRTIPTPTIAHLVVGSILEHYVVIYSVKSDVVRYMDPADGQIYKMPIDEFAKQWTGVLLLISPSTNFRTGNEQVSNFSRFLFLIRPHRSILVQSVFGAVLYTILGLSTAIYIQKITDSVLVNGNTNLLNLLSVVMLLLLVLQLFVGASKSVFILQIGQKIDAQLILGYYKHLLKLPQQFFDTMRVGEIISRVNDAVKIRQFINETVVGLVVNLFIVFFSFILMFLYSWKLALILMIIVPLYGLLYWWINRLNKKQERKLMEGAAELESQLVESIQSVKTIKQFGIEEFENLKTEKRFISLLNNVYVSGLNSIFSTFSSEFITRLFTILVLWIGSYAVLSQSISPGELLSFYALVGYFTTPLTSLVSMNKSIQNALIASDRLFDIMDLQRESGHENIELKHEYLGDIRFQNVSFSYGTRTEVFSNFDFEIPKGKLTAIIGESGSGKSTIALLLQKLYHINGGEISIGEHNIDSFTMMSLRRYISAVPQELTLFAGSVVENIALGEFNPNMDRVVEVCRLLGILHFIEQLPHGFSTYVGENGASLSGGQKQRLAIARAIYKNPEILILDEATSSLDSESEEYVRNAISQLVASGKTVLLIAHRLSSVVDADKIAVLKLGKIVEEGSHDSLFDARGIYYSMWQKQMPQRIK